MGGLAGGLEVVAGNAVAADGEPAAVSGRLGHQHDGMA